MTSLTELVAVARYYWCYVRLSIFSQICWVICYFVGKCLGCFITHYEFKINAKSGNSFEEYLKYANLMI